VIERSPLSSLDELEGGGVTAGLVADATDRETVFTLLGS